MRLNITFTAFTAFCTCNLKKCQKTVLTKLTKPSYNCGIGFTLSSAVAFVEFAPSGSLGGVFFGRYVSDLLNDDFRAWVVRI